MVATLSSSEEKVYGANGKNVVSLLNRLSQIDWFSALGKDSDQAEAEKAVKEFTQNLDISEYQIRWMSKEQVAPFINGIKLEQSSLWFRLESIPNSIKEKAEESGRLAVLTNTIDRVSEILFHGSFEGAFREFEEDGATVVKTAVGSVMYLFGLACAWEALADLEGWESNPYLPLIEAFEKGHWPLGLFDDQFYVA